MAQGAEQDGVQVERLQLPDAVVRVEIRQQPVFEVL
jgi:hypothetical protein